MFLRPAHHAELAPPRGSGSGVASPRRAIAPRVGRTGDADRQDVACPQARPPNGPIRLIRLVARLPKCGSMSMPPRTASVARAPAIRAPNRSRTPARSVNGWCIGTCAPPAVTSNRAPAMAQITSALLASSGPINVTSSAAAPVRCRRGDSRGCANTRPSGPRPARRTLTSPPAEILDRRQHART